MNEMAAMVEQVGRAVSAAVSRATAPISRQIDELLAWRASVGELRNGIDGAPGTNGATGVAGKDGAPGLAGKDGADGINGKDGAPGLAGVDGKDGTPGRDAPAVDVDAVVAKVLPLIPVPKDGRDGRDGADGIRGADGVNGRDGADGSKGQDGIAGRDGADGGKGADGRDGKDGLGIKEFAYDANANTLDIVMDDGSPFTLQLPTPARGEKGEKGIDGIDGNHGRDGAAGIDGKDGASGIDGKDGSPGLRGEKGDPPSTEEVAAAITKACDALLPAMVSKHMESLMPEIITRASLLVPPGRDGLPGRPGTPGEDGKPGVGIEGVELDFAGKRTGTLILRMSDGGRQEMPVNIGPVLRDAGVHRPGADYEEGDCVTHGGSYWVAKADTNATPGKSDDWRMVVKRGRDGKDAPGVEE